MGGERRIVKIVHNRRRRGGEDVKEMEVDESRIVL